MNRTPMKRWRWRPAVSPVVRERIVERSGGWCEARLPICAGGATDPAHRITRKFGGRHGEAKVQHDQLANVMDLCQPCHRWTHGNVTAAKALGLALSEGDDPESCPVAYRGRIAYLSNDGTIRYSDNPPGATDG